MSDGGPKCEGDEHERDPRDDLYCARCGWAVCFGCGHAFDIVCDLCDRADDEPDAFANNEP